MLKPFSEFTEEVEAVCAQLFAEYGIRYFDYARYYQSGKCIALFSNSNYPDYFANHEVFKSMPPLILSPGAHLWMEYIPRAFLNVVSETFNYDHGITICCNYPDYREVFNFAAKPENPHILSLYLNNLGILHKFKQDFLKKLAHVIHKLEKEPQIILTNQSKLLKPEPCSGILANLTKRQLDCLTLLSKGLTAKEIARKLNISFRTVEKHIDAMRERLGCKNRTEIVTLLSKEESFFFL